jgi:hypothetical protein
LDEVKNVAGHRVGWESKDIMGNDDVVIDLDANSKEPTTIKSLVKRMKSTRRAKGKKVDVCVIL